MANVKVSQRSSRWVLGFGADEEVIERARATWGGVFVPKRTEDRLIDYGAAIKKKRI
jgi:hypothetical protein